MIRAGWLSLLAFVLVACSTEDGPRYLSKKGHYSIASLDGWTETRDLGTTVFSDGEGATIAVRALAKEKGWTETRGAKVVFPATKTVLAALPHAQVSGPNPVALDGFDAAAFDLTFTPGRGGGAVYERRHVVLIGRHALWHVMLTGKARTLANARPMFERTLRTFREEG